MTAFRAVNVGGMVLTEDMNFFTDLNSQVAAISGLLPAAVTAEELGAAIQSLDGAQVLRLAELTAHAQKTLEQISLVTSAVFNARSTRDAGHAGLAQSLGHRTTAALIQQVTGVSRNIALQQIRVGEALLDTTTMVETVIESDDGVPVVVPVRQTTWHESLTTALRASMLSSAQHDAIKQGLGEPPVATDETSNVFSSPNTMTVDAATANPATIEAWSLAATQLVEYAKEVSVEELAKQARAIRDLLDPEGAHARFLAKYERRMFRMWTDSEGLTHGKFIFDDESAEWVRTIIDTALRPRRGGPRFVTTKEQAAAQTLKDDPRTNDQLTHDLLIDVLRAGAVADAKTVFGARQAGIKLVQVVNRGDYLAGIGSPVTRFQESGITLPDGMGEKHRCNTSIQPVVVDETGDPLMVGREERLFTTKQRVALAIRDGGCRWTGCDRPASYCEAHHIDHWGEDHGRTDIDRGVLLCRFHHMQLHNNGWKITRDERGPFLLHTPPGTTPIKARSRTGSSTEAGVKVGAFETHHAATQGLSPEKPGPIFEGTSLPKPGPQYGNERPEHEADPPGQMPELARQKELANLAKLARSTEPVELRPPLPLKYAWQLAAPTAQRFRTAA